MVGLNVAADPLFTAGYMGVERRLTSSSPLTTPVCHSSQNEQDNRHYARAAKIAMVEPSAIPRSARTSCKMACEISEEFDTPVLYRTTTRVAVTARASLTFGERTEHVAPAYKRNVRKFICTPANAYMNHPLS